MNKAYMEAHKLDLMTEVADLRVRLQTAELDRNGYKERYERLQVCFMSSTLRIVMMICDQN